MKNKTLLTILLVFFLAVLLTAGDKTVNKTFAAKKLVEIKTVSGDCTVLKGAAGKVKVTLVYDYDPDCYKPEFIEEDDRLVLKEDFTRSGSCSGHSHWTVVVPARTDIRLVSASGNFTLEGVNGNIETKLASGDIRVTDAEGDFEVKTASGDIEVKNLSGKIEFLTASGDVKGTDLDGEMVLKTASGDVTADRVKGRLTLKSASGNVKLQDARGEMILKSASGEVRAENVGLTGDSEFKSASGNVRVVLRESAAFDLEVASASGNAVLDYNGNPISGFFEFTVRVDRGRIVSPFAFDREDTESRYGQDYHVKSFVRGKKTPVVTIKSASGKAELKK